jgi:hypothetical protein
MESEEKFPAELSPQNTIRVETALSRYPVHRLARRGSIKIDLNKENPRGEATVKWRVSYNSEYGQPGPLAYKLDTLLINRRIEEARRPIPKIIRLGSLKEICRELGMAETGGNTNQIKKSLFQNALAGITAKTIYRTSDGTERTLEAVFTRYSVILTGEKLPDGRKADAVYVMLNDIFMQVINGAMTRPLDYDYLKSLPPAPQRFYELLSYQMYAALRYDRPRAKLTYSEFCAHAPQTRHLEWERARLQMHKVHRLHRQSGYIAEVDFQETTDSDGQPDWVMLYKPGPKALAEYRAFTKRGGPNVLEIEALEPTPPVAVPEITELEQELLERNITPGIAAELVRNHSEEKIRAQMERLDWLLEKKPEKVDDPAAYLVGAIKNDYAAPKGFVSKAERQRRAEAKQARERQAAEERRRQQEAEAKERAARQAATEYWDSLTSDQQEELDAASRETVDAETLAAENGPFKATMQRMRRERYILNLLASHSLEAAGE